MTTPVFTFIVALIGLFFIVLLTLGLSEWQERRHSKRAHKHAH